jgi:hypothetical protein
MNKLYLYHRPTEQWILLAQRGGFGWCAVATELELSNMLQRAANGLDAVPSGHQDDFLLLMDDAGGAPYVFCQFAWDGDQIKLDPALAFDGAANRDEAAFSLERTLGAVYGVTVFATPAAPPAAQQRELKANAVLRKENAELRAGAAHLVELLALRKLGQQIYDHELLRGPGEPHPQRQEFLERKALAWSHAAAWAEGLELRLKQWREGVNGDAERNA